LSRSPLSGGVVRRLAVLVAGSAALLVTTVVDRGPSLTSDGFVPLAAAQGACARPSMGTEDAILTAAEGFMLDSESADIFGYARLQRVEGDWARVVIVPHAPTDHALLILQRRAGTWKIVAGPGTAFGPDDAPGTPKAIFDACPA
jgi:hypothetical protein